MFKDCCELSFKTDGMLVLLSYIKFFAFVNQHKLKLSLFLRYFPNGACTCFIVIWRFFRHINHYHPRSLQYTSLHPVQILRQKVFPNLNLIIRNTLVRIYFYSLSNPVSPKKLKTPGFNLESSVVSRQICSL